MVAVAARKLKFTMKPYLAIFLCMAGQASLLTQALSQVDVKAASALPLDVSIQKVFTLRVSAIQVAVRNNSHSQLTLDKQRLEAPGLSVTKRLDTSDGTIQELHWGSMSGIFGGPDANAISHDIKRAVSIPPGGEFKIQLALAQVLAGLPHEFQGAAVHIYLEFRNLIIAVNDNPPASAISRAVFVSNTVELTTAK